MTGVFITGTDTDCGKTMISQMLVKQMVAEGKRVAVMKPIASGAINTLQGLRNDDAEILLAASNAGQSYDSCNPYAFTPPVSPHIAAAQVGVDIDILKIADISGALQKDTDFLLVEGVGGWMAPISATKTVEHLSSAINLPVLLVVGVRLGCLNHALLTIAAIKASGQHLIAWVANIMSNDMINIEQNISTLQQKIDAPMIGIVAHNQLDKNEFDINYLFKESLNNP